MSDDRTLVIKHGALGDIVLATAAMKAIRAHHRRDRITLLTRPEFASFFSSCPFIDDLLIDIRPDFWNLLSLIKLLQRLRQPQFRRVYDLQTSARTRWYHALMDRRNGLEWCGNLPGVPTGFYEPARSTMHLLDIHREQLKRAGILTVAEPDVSWASTPLANFEMGLPIVVLVPGSSASHPEKRWPSRSFAATASAAHEIGFRVAIVGSASEAPLAREIISQCPDAIDLSGKTTIGNLVWLAQQVTHAVGNDTGPMHVFAAGGAPCTILFSGASDPARAAPRGKHVGVIQRPQLKDLESCVVLERIKGARRFPMS